MPQIIPNHHPIFVHFTVALLSLAVGLFVVMPFIKGSLKEQWLIVARWSLWFGASFAVITGMTGLYAYNTVTHDTPSHIAMGSHRNWAIATITAFLLLAVWCVIRVRAGICHGKVFVVCLALSGALLTSTAWHGGELVYRYGLGVMALPKADQHHHHEGKEDDQAGMSLPQAETGHSDDSHDHGDEHGDDQTR